MKTRNLFLAILILLIAIFLLMEGLRDLNVFKEARPKEEARAKVDIMVEPGDSLVKVAKKLKEGGVISNEKVFVLFGELKGADKKIQAGEYELDPEMRSKDVLKILTEGRQKYYRFLAPDGFNIWDISKEVDKMWPGSGPRFLLLCKDKTFINSLGVSADSLEGYLYPDTYFLRRFDTLEILLKRMIGKFNRSWTPEYEQRAIELGYTRHQIITIASIIEKEAGRRDEKPVVAAVIYNRLKKKMPLCMDPTVIYGLLPNFNGNLTKSELAGYNPYNTYQVSGLPPGPICNPGDRAIRAALWPEKADYLYFVSKGDGSHFFSTRYADHAQAVNLYQRQPLSPEPGETSGGILQDSGTVKEQ